MARRQPRLFQQAQQFHSSARSRCALSEVAVSLLPSLHSITPLPWSLLGMSQAQHHELAPAQLLADEARQFPKNTEDPLHFKHRQREVPFRDLVVLSKAAAPA